MLKLLNISCKESELGNREQIIYGTVGTYMSLDVVACLPGTGCGRTRQPEYVIAEF
jgi:hypothetical protein